MTSGIYEIVNIANGKNYVGSSINMKKRWSEHRSGLRNNKHHARVLQRAWTKYGEESFVFRPLLICAEAMLVFYEQRALDVIKPEYNATLFAASPATDSVVRGKIRAALIGHRVSDETRAKQAAVKRGRKQTPEAVAARVAGLAARSPEAKRATAEKLSVAGKLHYANNPTARASIGAASKGRKATEEQKAKLRAYALNRPEKHNAKLSAAATARYANLKKDIPNG